MNDRNKTKDQLIAELEFLRGEVATFKQTGRSHPDTHLQQTTPENDITRKQAEAALVQKSRQEKLLWSISQAIRQSLDLNVILNTAVTEVRQTLQTDRATVYRFNLDWSGDFVVESVGEDWVKLIGCNIQKACEDVYLQETQGGRFRNHEIFAIADINATGLHPCHIQLLEQFQAKAYMAVPIFSGEFLWGLLVIYQNTAPRNWQSWEVELLEQIASQLAIAIQQTDYYKIQNRMTDRQILVVDDEEHLRELVQACLEDLGGWETLVAGSGEQCLEILKTARPNAILLDISMPRMDGIAVYDRIQSDPMTRSIPVILLTAKVLPSDRAKFAEMGVSGVIAKPIQPVTLTEEVAEILGWED